MNAPAHIVLSVQQFLTKNGMIPLHHPPYSSYLVRSNIFFFPRRKKVLIGKRFADVEEVKQQMAEALKDIKIDKFKTVLSSGKKSLDRCIT